MAEESDKLYTREEVEAALKVERIDKDVQFIKEALVRVENSIASTNAAVAGTNHTIQSIVNTAIAESNQRNEAMMTGLASRIEIMFAAQEKVTNVKAEVTTEKLSTLMPWRDTVQRWSGGLALIGSLTFLFALVMWLLNRFFPAIKP